MTWIIVTRHIPTDPSPPILSMHWATPWADEDFAKEQLARLKYSDETDEAFLAQDRFLDQMGVGFEPNYARGMRVNFGGEDIRVFPHEYNLLDSGRMRLYIHGDATGDGSHELVPNREADAALLRTALETDLRDIFDAALVDGCNPAMAYDVARGIDILDADMEFPPHGWYRMRREYAEYLGYARSY